MQDWDGMMGWDWDDEMQDGMGWAAGWDDGMGWDELQDGLGCRMG